MAPTRYVAHRGGAALWPENSLLAFRNAIALGESTSRDLMEVVGHEECEQLVADLRQLRGKLEAHLRSSAHS